MKILVADNSKISRSYLKKTIKHWFANQLQLDCIEINEESNGIATIEKIKTSNYDLVFFNMVMDQLNGLEILEEINKLNLDKNITTILNTSLNDKKYQPLAMKLGLNYYLEKPIEIEELECILNNILSPDKEHENPNNIIFNEFDDIDDSNYYNELSIDNNLMKTFNKSHKAISAKEFLKNESNLDYIINDMDDINSNVTYITNIIYQDNIYENINNIIEILNNYIKSLSMFVNFVELTISLQLLIDILDELYNNQGKVEFDEEDREYIVIFLKALLQDLSDWNHHVFILQDAINVYYINASSLNSCIELEYFIKSKIVK